MSEWSFKAWLKTAVRMGIAPSEFWQLSLTDWFAMTGQRGQPMGRADLQNLSDKYPD